MKTIIKTTLLCVICIFSSCKYDDFIYDFDFSAVYFAYQRPVRTVFSDNPQIELGAVLGGKRENKTRESVKFKIAPEMLTKGNDYIGEKEENQYKLLPADYYTLSHAENMFIEKGEMLGKVTLKLNEKFLSDPNANKNYYALPLQIIETSADSILGQGENPSGAVCKDYTIIVIKYISRYHGVYYQRGERSTFNATTGTLIDTKKYVEAYEEDVYLKPWVWNMTTESPNTILSSGLVEFQADAIRKYSVAVTVNNDNSVMIRDNTTGLPEGAISNFVSKPGSVYDPTKKEFLLNYEFVNAITNTKYVASDKLIFRNDNLKLELWSL